MHCHIDAHLDTGMPCCAVQLFDKSSGMMGVFIEDIPNAPQTTTFLETCVTHDTGGLNAYFFFVIANYFVL